MAKLKITQIKSKNGATKSIGEKHVQTVGRFCRCAGTGVFF